MKMERRRSTCSSEELLARSRLVRRRAEVRLGRSHSSMVSHTSETDYDVNSALGRTLDMVLGHQRPASITDSVFSDEDEVDLPGLEIVHESPKVSAELLAALDRQLKQDLEEVDLPNTSKPGEVLDRIRAKSVTSKSVSVDERSTHAPAHAQRGESISGAFRWIRGELNKMERQNQEMICTLLSMLKDLREVIQALTAQGQLIHNSNARTARQNPVRRLRSESALTSRRLAVLTHT